MCVVVYVYMCYVCALQSVFCVYMRVCVVCIVCVCCVVMCMYLQFSVPILFSQATYFNKTVSNLQALFCRIYYCVLYALATALSHEQRTAPSIKS